MIEGVGYCSYCNKLVLMINLMLLSFVIYTAPPQVPECSADVWSATSIKISWIQPGEQCRVDVFKITWTTADIQPLPCSKIGSNNYNSKIIESGDLTEIFLRELNVFHTYDITITAVNVIGNSTCNLTVTTLGAGVDNNIQSFYVN